MKQTWIVDANDCHIWTGEKNVQGYGRLRVNGRLALAHRARYEREIGPIPDGLVLDHFVCDNGAGGCCNPLHCRPVSPRENLLRSDRTVASINLAKSTCPRGHDLSGDNLRVRADGGRSCRICRNELRREKNAARVRIEGWVDGRKRRQTHCTRGHALEVENLRSSDFERTGRRKCRLCRNERERADRQSKTVASIV